MTSAQSKRTVLITGGSRGIGQALINEFKSADYLVAATTRTGHFDHVQPHLKLNCDVKNKVQIYSCIEIIQKTWGKLDVLINNAGIAGAHSLDPLAPDFDRDDHLWDELFAVNLNGTYQFSKAAFSLLKKSGSGRVINIASILGLIGVPDQPAYCASKHAVVGLTRSLALAWGAHNITVNAICPSWVDTDMAHQRFKEMGISPPKMSYPIDIAKHALQLAAETSGNITGQTPVIEEGRVC